MSTPTLARPTSRADAHWYDATGKPCHWVPCSTKEGNRPTTIADAKRSGLLPSVTTLIKLLAKPELQNWLIEQTLLSALTAPRLPDEGLDAFVKRILHTERQPDAEAKAARELGSAIHDALAKAFQAEWPLPHPLIPYVLPVYEAVSRHCQGGAILAVETVLIGHGYAGTCDLVTETPEAFWLWDWKSCKTLPTKGAWPEARIQLAFYAAAWQSSRMLPPDAKPIRCANVYISTAIPGQFVICEHEQPWPQVYDNACVPLLKLWRWLNNFPLACC